MNYQGQQPIHYQRQAEIERGKQRPYLGPQAAAEEAAQVKETLVTTGSKFRFYVLNDSVGEDVGYRLREIPIDPERDYSQVFQDFMHNSSEVEGVGAFKKALEVFDRGNEEFNRLIERAKLSSF